MTEAGAFVYILIGKISTSCIADHSVNDGYFPVTSVIDFTVRISSEKREDGAVYAHLSKGLEIVAGQCGHASEVVIYQLDINTLRNLSFQNVEYIVPEDPVLYYEIFHENKVLCVLKVGKQRGEQLFSGREISLLGVCEQVSLRYVGEHFCLTVCLDVFAPELFKKR